MGLRGTRCDCYVRRGPLVCLSVLEPAVSNKEVCLFLRVPERYLAVEHGKYAVRVTVPRRLAEFAVFALTEPPVERGEVVGHCSFRIYLLVVGIVSRLPGRQKRK